MAQGLKRVKTELSRYLVTCFEKRGTVSIRYKALRFTLTQMKTLETGWQPCPQKAAAEKLPWTGV